MNMHQTVTILGSTGSIGVNTLDVIARHPGRFAIHALTAATQVELLLKHGFTYESSMMGDDYTPYRARLGDRPTVDQPFVFGKPTRLVEMPISWTLDDYPHFEFVRTPQSVLGLVARTGVL